LLVLSNFQLKKNYTFILHTFILQIAMSLFCNNKMAWVHYKEKTVMLPSQAARGATVALIFFLRH
jgi:hypothetical protein